MLLSFTTPVAARDLLRIVCLASFMVLFLPAAKAQQRVAAALTFTRAEIEQMLSKASIGNERDLASGAVHISLDDGTRKHGAAVWTPDRDREPGGNVYLNVAAYELDKALQLNMVAPAVERMVKGQRAVVQWWLDNIAMMEMDRIRKNILPPDPESWNQQMQAARLFDELISNAWRPGIGWDSLLVTRDWKIYLVDHRRVFRTNTQLELPETLTQCDRTLLANLRALNKKALKRTLGKYLSSYQLDALESRRKLLVKHFTQLIATKGESAVLYDLPARP